MEFLLEHNYIVNLINHLIYADDTVLIGPSPHSLQTLIKICQDYAHKNNILFNTIKSATMCIKPNSIQTLYVPEFYLNCNVLKVVHTYKYLGVVIADKKYR